MLTLALSLVSAGLASAQSSITVHLDKPGVKISPMYYGLMTEEINHSYDGGLYAELIRNRAFKDSATGPVFWSLLSGPGAGGKIDLEKDALDKTPTLRLDVQTADKDSSVSIANEGYWGIPVKPKTAYRATFYAKASSDFSGPLTLSIESNDRKTVYATATSSKISGQWQKYELTLKTSDAQPATTNRFLLTANTPGTVWFKYVSLFPPTFKGRKNGTRPDLMEKMGAMKPSFLRFPGGNYLEGNTIAERFDWKKTLGDPAFRPGHPCPWGYPSTDGLGLLEFLEWCEDLKMEPVLAVFAGYALGGEHIPAGPGLLPHVQDALDEIEYVTGDTSTKWGAQRAKDGHPKPFPLTYVEIGNEDWFDRSGSYDGRFGQFYDAIKAKYPKLQLIATTPVKSRKADVVDDHYYRNARQMAQDSGHYDSYDRTGPKIFVGEWATTMGRPTPTMEAALGDAAWMTGMERNSDLIVMECYAPLFVNVNPGASQWGTNLIGYNALTSFGSPSFYVQTMFGQNTGDTVLPVTIRQPAVSFAAPPAMYGGVGFSTYRTDSEYKDLKVTSGDTVLYSKDFSTGTEGWTHNNARWSTEDGALRLSGGQPESRAFGQFQDWKNYTVHVKARKHDGAEGFMVLFHAKDRENYWQWNIGGWGNTRSAIQHTEDGSVDEVGQSKDFTVEKDRWYDIRIEVVDGVIKGYIDDQLITEVKETSAIAIDPLYVAASKKGSDVFLKIVNFSDTESTTTLNLEGVKSLGSKAQGWVLSGDLKSANSIADPTKISPKELKLTSVSKSFKHTFPAHSVTVLRLKAK